jgi:hypothetical protein
MSSKEKIFLFILGGLLSCLILYLSVWLWISDSTLSIVPGWHTTIYPPEILWTVFTFGILIAAIIVCSLFRATTKLMSLMIGMVKGS